MGWLRVVTYQLPESASAEPLKFVKENIQDYVQVLETQPGFVGAYWGESPGEHTISAVTHWTSLAAIEAAGDRLKELQATGPARGIHVIDTINVELFPVPAMSMWTDEDEPPTRRRRLFGRRNRTEAAR